MNLLNYPLYTNQHFKNHYQAELYLHLSVKIHSKFLTTSHKAFTKNKALYINFIYLSASQNFL